jgi:hypothetical protein
MACLISDPRDNKVQFSKIGRRSLVEKNVTKYKLGSEIKYQNSLSLFRSIKWPSPRLRHHTKP